MLHSLFYSDVQRLTADFNVIERPNAGEKRVFEKQNISFLKTGLTLCLLLLCLSPLPITTASAQGINGIEHLAPLRLESGASSLQSSSRKADYIPGQSAGQMLPYKNDALAGRQPLVLVHGIGGTEGSRLSEWDNFLAYTDKLPDFEKRFKVYLFHYDSAKSVQTLSKLLAQELEALIAQGKVSEGIEARKIKILAYSEGGLLTRNALQSEKVNGNVEQVITVATPFHGSPLASREWFCDQLVQGPVFDPIRISRKIAYWVAQKKHPHFEDDFHWDNIDNIIENVNAAPAQTPEPVEYALESKPNFIAYGSFFGTPSAVDQQMVNSLSLKIPMPVEKIKLYTGKAFIFNLVNRAFANIGKLASKSITATAEKIPEKIKPSPEKIAPDKTNEEKRQLASESDNETDAMKQAGDISQDHALLSLANETIQNESLQKGFLYTGIPYASVAPEPTTDKPEAHAPSQAEVTISSISMMPFNDGISPISSSLWLGRFTPQFKSDTPIPSKRLWAALRSLKGTDRARLFAGLDHRDWIEGENRTNAVNIPDLLNPQEKAKSVFGWLVSDLMQASPAQAAQVN